MTVDYYEDLQQRIPAASLASCDKVFDKTRMVKTQPEIDALTQAARGTDDAIQHALNAQDRETPSTSSRG